MRAEHFLGKRELVALLSLSSWCLMIVVWLFPVVPWVCLQFVIVVFPDHTHLLFFILLHMHLSHDALFHNCTNGSTLLNRRAARAPDKKKLLNDIS